MRLRAGHDLQTAHDLLNGLAESLKLVFEPIDRGVKTDCRSTWLEWYQLADGHLRHVFTEWGLITSLYQTAAEIRASEPPRPVLAAYSADPAVEALARRAQQVWIERLLIASGYLARLEHFVSRPGRIAVLDTSAFHENDRFWRADWARITEEADLPDEAASSIPIRLLVPLVVVEELDTQKRHPNGKVRESARDILRHLRDLPRESATAVADVLRLDDRVTLEVLLDDPRHVRVPVADAEIIDRAVYLRNLFPPSVRVILVSGDLSMIFRAEGLGLETKQVSRSADDAPLPHDA
jgi:hypothetical protein